MRKIITALLGTVAVALSLVTAGGASASSHTPAVTACHFYGHGAKILNGTSRVWITGSTCSRQEFYNRSYCVYRYNLHNWVNGPKRYGNGTVNFNASNVACTTYGPGGVYEVWIEYLSLGRWYAHRLL